MTKPLHPPPRRFSAALGACRSGVRGFALGKLGSGGLILVSPALLAAASGSVVVLGGAIGLLAASTAFLFRPGGWVGIVLALVSWAGALSLGATGLRVMVMTGRMRSLEAALKSANAELARAQADKDRSLLRDLKRQAAASPTVEAPSEGQERAASGLRRAV